MTASNNLNAADSACNPTVDSSCLHGGQMMSKMVPGRSSCSGLNAEDRLKVFEWVCDESVNPVHFVSTGFKPDMGLSDLLDFDSETFRENYLHIFDAGSIVANATSEVWWNNTVVVANNGGSVTNSGEINIVTQNTNTTYSVDADRVALVIRPGVVLTGSVTTNETVVSASNRNSLWVEGVIDATGDDYALNFSATSFSGILNQSSNNNSLSQITASGNSSYGVTFFNLTNNTVTGRLQIGDNGSYNCFVSSATNSGLMHDTCSDSGFDDSSTYGTSRSDAILTTGVSTVSSFVDPAIDNYSLLATDNDIRAVLTADFLS